MADKQEEAGKLMKKASKAISPSLFDFRLKPDWEVAAPLFERAAVLFKQVGRFEDASEAYERASTAQEKLQSPFHAAKHMEAAAETARLSKSWDKVFEYTKSAAELYINANRATVAADCLARGARQLEEHDVEHALTLLYDAVDIYESDTKEANAADVFRQAISLLVRAKRYPEAVEMMMRFGSQCDRVGARSSQCKCYLGAIVTHLFAKEAREAWMVFQDALAIDAFVSSEEAFAADALFSAYRSGEEDEVQRVVKSKSVFKQLENQVARLAMKLPQGRMDKLSRRLNRAMGSPEEEGRGEGEEEGEGQEEAQGEGARKRVDEEEELL
ncbi:hypothetical protein QJQ45_010880 [Haematococcus lacustris]|nr:hypothetical protein QJQ45_010880 [Haematococcus lacustris]